MPSPANGFPRLTAAVGLASCTLLVLLAAACGDKGTGPGTRPDTTTSVGPRVELKAGTPASGTVTLSGRPGLFVIRGPVGQQLRLFLQSQSGRAADTLMALVEDSARRACCWYLRSAGSDTSLTANGTMWLQVAAGDPLYVDVTGLRADDAGPFSLLLYPLDTRPEKLGPRFAIGDTVSGESIDVPGDVDDFYFAAQAGEELIVFVQSQAGSSLQLQATVTDSGSTNEIVDVISTGRDTSLLGQPAPRWAVSKTGTYRLRIAGEGPVWQDWPFVSSEVRGPYRFFVARIRRTPERAPALLALGDTSTAEAIDLPGDIDEFGFDGSAGTEINLMVQVLQGLAGGVDVQLLQPDGGELGRADARGPTAALDDVGTGRLTLPVTGRYTVRVQGASLGSPAQTMGSYRFELYRIDRRPEHVSDLAPVPVTVTGESIDRPADIDEFHMPAAPGKRFALALSSDPGARITLEVRADTTLVGSAGTGNSPTANSYLMPAPDSGSYTLRVFSWNNGVGRYSFESYEVSLAPETLPVQIVPGVPVVGERIDRLMDVDTFTFAGVEGQEVNVFLRRDAGYTGELELWLRQAWTPAGSGPWLGYNAMYVADGSSTLDSTNTGRLRLPSTGAYNVIVGRSMGSGSGTGPYSFLVFPIDRRPEGRAAAFAIGDTVREQLSLAGDIDEYTFSASAGDKLTLWMQADSILRAWGPGFEIDIVDPTGQALGYPIFVGSTRDIDLTLTGTYTLRAWQPDPTVWAYDRIGMSQGHYAFALTRRP